jgi:ubiquitin related modifier 1
MQVDFLGGLDTCFGAKSLALDPVPATIGQLVQVLAESHLKENPDFFTQDRRLRKGILVLINERDWELLDKEDSQLARGDQVTFISTLHGG